MSGLQETIIAEDGFKGSARPRHGRGAGTDSKQAPRVTH